MGTSEFDSIPIEIFANEKSTKHQCDKDIFRMDDRLRNMKIILQSNVAKARRQTVSKWNETLNHLNVTDFYVKIKTLKVLD